MADWRYVCEACGHAEPLDAAIWRCPVCGEALALDGPNDLTAAEIARDDPTLWRYQAILPVDKEYAHWLGEGMTPLVRGTLAGRPVWFKCDHLLPTGSFKDRGAAVLVAHLKRLGIERIIVDSSGNAAAAMAGYSAAAGLGCTVYAPATTSPGKLVQSRAFGAAVVPVEGNREAVASAAQEAAVSAPGAFYASHNWHPVFVEGVKTWALEVWEQLGGESPAICFVPTGGGSAFVGAWRGFSAVPGERPQLVAAQPVACAPFVIAHIQQQPFRPITPDATIAEGTRIGAPARHRQVMAAIAESGGRGEAVSDVQLIETLRELWAQGLYVEPTAAVGAAACRATILRQAAGATGMLLGAPLPEGEIVVLLTGSGLKATETIGTLV